MTTAEFDPELIYQAAGEIAAAQDTALGSHVRYCLDHSPYYQDRLQGIDPATVSLSELPLTDKNDFARENDRFLAVPPEQVADIVFSSGTTGKPNKVAYTDNDLKRLAYNEAQSFRGCGITAADVMLLTCTMDRCFIAGLAYFVGARELGATVIRNGHGTLESHGEVIARTQPTVLVGVPSFLRKLALYLKDQGIDTGNSSVKKLVCIGEAMRGRDMELTSAAREMEELWNAQAYSTYASSETITTFCECTERHGGHLLADLGILEILDDEGQPVPEGTLGEIVVTPLQIEGMPLIRFRTGDVSFLDSTPCSCGRNTPRLGPILGRKNQMMKVHGTSIYPPAVFAALGDIQEVSEFYVAAEKEEDETDRLTIHLALKDGNADRDAIRRKLQAVLRVTPQVIVEPESDIRKVVFTAASRKPIRFIDRR